MCASRNQRYGTVWVQSFCNSRSVSQGLGLNFAKSMRSPTDRSHPFWLSDGVDRYLDKNLQAWVMPQSSILEHVNDALLTIDLRKIK
jgi:hypothetical protein